MTSQILTDPFVIEEELPLQVAQDVTTYEVTAAGIAQAADYSQSVSMTGKKIVMRVAWTLPVPRFDQTSVKREVIGDSRGRLVTPLGFSIRATNVSNVPLWWHVNTPYQEGDRDGAIVSRVGDKSVEIKPGQTRVHAHAWGNGAHMFPLRGALTADKQTYQSSCALADYFFIRDKYGAADSVIQAGHVMVKVDVSIKYHVDKANQIDVRTVETRKPVSLIDLGSFNALYHVDPLAVTSTGRASPIFTTPNTKDPYLMVLSGAGNSVKLVSVNDAGGTDDNVSFVGVPNSEDSIVQVMMLNVTYRDRDQNIQILNTFVRKGPIWKLTGEDGNPATWTGSLAKFRAPAWSPCLAFQSTTVSRVRRLTLPSGRVAIDHSGNGVVPWPQIISFALDVGTRILSLLLPRGSEGTSLPKARKNAGKKKKGVKSSSRQK